MAEFRHPLVAGIGGLINEYVVENSNPMLKMLWKIIGADFPSVLRSLDDNDKLCEDLRQRFHAMTKPPIIVDTSGEVRALEVIDNEGTLAVIDQGASQKSRNHVQKTKPDTN